MTHQYTRADTVLVLKKSSTPRERSSVSSITATRKASPRVSRQVLRYEAEQDDLTKCRTRKRSSEIRPHRVDHMYYMTGTSLKLEPRYKVEEEELQHCREDEGETQRQLVDEHRSQFSRSSHDSVFILDRNRDTKAQLPLLLYDSRVHIKIPQADKSTEYSTSTKD
ncbi:hypothetical protein LSH36_37g06023 [Paralvinella palmiformis]|uniref:Uncharacterized protein n=1 Tax=Paralvinella palmiformis TaxID=53620 RepID=A0AAD9NFF1_9ANNE|nr:hypothetical protein LSH36_37g06023 [Paralvinella palmiformis]